MVDKAKFAAEEALGYRIVVVGRQVQVTEAMKNYAIEKLSKIDKFHNHIMDIHVTMDIQKLEHVVTIVLMLSHIKVKVQAVSNDMYVSIDRAVDRLQTQLRRWKSRIQDHHKKALSAVDMQVNVVALPGSEIEEFNADIEAEAKLAEALALQPPQVIGTETLPLKLLTVNEAVMKIELSGDHFLLFRDEEDRKLKVIYRRSDGNYGIIKPE